MTSLKKQELSVVLCKQAVLLSEIHFNNCDPDGAMLKSHGNGCVLLIVVTNEPASEFLSYKRKSFQYRVVSIQ